MPLLQKVLAHHNLSRFGEMNDETLDLVRENHYGICGIGYL